MKISHYGKMTSGEFMEFLKEGLNRTVATEPVSPLANTHKKYVYGIAGTTLVVRRREISLI